MSVEAPVIEVAKEACKAPITGFRTGVTNTLVVDDREVVPLVFVPGIMGSRLQTGSGKKVWDPDDAKFMLLNFGMFNVDAADRKKLIIGDGAFKSAYLEVCDEHPAFKPKSTSIGGVTFKKPSHYPSVAADNGWAGVAMGSYGAFLTILQTHEWPEYVRLRFELPVHASGYNWTASNDLAGLNLKSEIEEIIQRYKDKDRKCEKVILITHSMGGLVARSACKLHEADPHVLGVIHGVQPAMGAPAAYWRIKGGFERPGKQPEQRWYDWLKSPKKMTEHKALGTVAAWVLGSVGEEVTSLLGNMPGGLQLLPNKQYTVDEKGQESRWLKFLELDGTTKELPEIDPYEEIYREKEKFYRLVEPAWLDPGKKKPKSKDYGSDPWRFYLIYLKEAERFHDKLGAGVHPDSTQFYSKHLLTADKIVYSRELDSWTNKGLRLLKIFKDSLPMKGLSTAGGMIVKGAMGTSLMTPQGLLMSAGSSLASAAVKDSDWWVNRGGYRLRVDEANLPVVDDDNSKRALIFLMTMQLPDGLGDGTVPNSSSTALGRGDGSVPTRSIGARRKPDDPDKADYEESWLEIGHEPIYKTKAAQTITFAVVERLCKKIEEEA